MNFFHTLWERIRKDIRREIREYGEEIDARKDGRYRKRRSKS